MEDNPNGKQRTSIEQDFNGRLQQWKTTTMEENLHERKTHKKITSKKYDLKRR